MARKSKAERQAEIDALETTITEYIRAQDSAFDLDEAIFDIAENQVLDDAQGECLYSLLTESREGFYRPDGDDEITEMIVPRHIFFKGAKARVKLTPHEFKQKLLFPGHRFTPYLSTGIMPFEVVLKDPSGKEFPRKHHTCKTADAIPCHTLFGKMDMYLYLSVEQDNYNKPPEDIFEKDTCNLTVFDLADFIETHEFKLADSLIITLEDWKTGTFSVEHEPRTQVVDFGGVAQWCTSMEEALRTTFDEQVGFLPIQEQISQAYFNGPECLRFNPAIHFGGFLAKSKATAIAGFQQTTVLWRVHENPESELMERMMIDGYDTMFSDSFESLEDCLHTIGIALTETEVELFMKDAMANGEENWESVLKRMTLGRTEDLFDDDEEEEIFEEYMDELWEEVCESYDIKADARFKPLRAKLTAQSDAQLHFYRQLDSRGTDPSKLPHDLMSEVAGIYHQLVHIQELLCGPPSPELKSDFFVQASEMVDAITVNYNGVMKQILTKTPIDF